MLGTATLLQAAYRYWRKLMPAHRARFRFHHVSTDEVYGSLGEIGFFSETASYQPNSPYAASKAGADHLVLAWHRTYGLRRSSAIARTISGHINFRRNSSH